MTKIYQNPNNNSYSTYVVTGTFSKIACNETCDAEGSVDASLCDKTSGKCLSCKENVINDKCSECTPGNFPFPNCNHGMYKSSFL